MKRAILILSGLGLLCGIIEAAYILLPPQVTQQLPDQQIVSLVTTVMLVALPILGFADAILGVFAASQRRASRWFVAFIVLAIITLPMYSCGFILSILDAFPSNQGLGIVATVLLFFSVVVFLAALAFALRRPSLPAEQRQQLA